MQRRQPVERNADPIEPSLDGLFQPLGRQVAPPVWMAQYMPWERIARISWVQSLRR
ncbi:hypothetical protein ACEQUB_01540 [Ralstonia syzygii]